MFLKVLNKITNELVGFIHICHGCGCDSPVRKQQRLPKRWVQRTELAYGPTGLRRKGTGWAVNYYCPTCNSNGCTAYTVAATTRKLSPPKVKVELVG